MYVPQLFEEQRIGVMHALMRAHPFAALVTVASGSAQANHLPFHLDVSEAPFGRLRGHVAKGNPIWQGCDGLEALVIFQGPHTYVSPSWYPSKREHGKVVPTWNYAVVHAHGTLSVVDDAERLRAHVSTLTRQQEADRPEPWDVSDAPDDFVEGRLGGIRGLEVRITGLTGKWKMSQNRGVSDREGVVRALREVGTETALAVAEQIPGSSK